MSSGYRMISWTCAFICGWFLGGTFISGFGVFASYALNLTTITISAIGVIAVAIKTYPREHQSKALPEAELREEPVKRSVYEIIEGNYA